MLAAGSLGLALFSYGMFPQELQLAAHLAVLEGSHPAAWLTRHNWAEQIPPDVCVPSGQVAQATAMTTPMATA